MKTILITGASSGFGMLAAVELAARGHRVMATMRTLDKAKELIKLAEEKDAGSQVLLHQLDVASADSIASLKEYLQGIDRVDVLINNAGFAAGGFSEEISIEEYREQFETNFFGVMAVTQAVLPIMRAQRSGKILNMSSISGLIGFPGLSPYVSSKHALEGYSESLRLEMKPFGIDVALIEPGSFSTNIWTTGKKVADASLDEASPYFGYMTAIEKEMERGSKNHGDPMDVVKLLADLCERDRLKELRFPIGKGVKAAILLKKVIPWKKWEAAVMKKLGF
ncbi:SDR family oxidoreductase [Metabacillus sp. GX 13764]|uniref:SDR family oxidoreductase n=1 Tax=Metabacillus kandeliae TaxID=2900151 RepID=UPI001E3B858C|nr:SDR family oxidoreductase [Metabacillus kandeliae]MCD7035131.1 SDR family oxidoreductase [Metabacillus kandeliae]